MSINMTQSFKFETDDLKSFRTILSKIMFGILFATKNGQYIQYHLFDEEPTFWPDGQDYRKEWLAQPAMMHFVDGEYYHLDVKETYGGTLVLGEGELFDNKDKAARASCAQYKKPKPTRLWVTTLADYKSSSLDKDKVTKCNNLFTMEQEAMDRLEKMTLDQVVDALGSGYNQGFNPDDGSIGLAYRMEWAPNGGWNQLHLSVTHAYYGK